MYCISSLQPPKRSDWYSPCGQTDENTWIYVILLPKASINPGPGSTIRSTFFYKKDSSRESLKLHISSAWYFRATNYCSSSSSNIITIYCFQRRDSTAFIISASAGRTFSIFLEPRPAHTYHENVMTALEIFLSSSPSLACSKPWALNSFFKTTKLAVTDEIKIHHHRPPLWVSRIFFIA